MTIRKVLIANRGEIACRIMRAAKLRGIATVAVYSDADRCALHVREADEAVHIGDSAPAESYLNIEAILAAAKATGADAIHPGYGFLAERADFARACSDAELIFMGPSPEAIAAMGDKANAKELMLKAGVPCIPGYQRPDQSDATFAAEAETIGYPLMIKASAGGGGRGMRVIQGKEELGEAIASARREAESAFGDGRLLLERLINGARHVEVQVFADAQGNTIHLAERDCSLQRRNQKVIEEAPSPVIDEAMRAQMGAAAVKAAKAVNYCGAGTVEFLFDPARTEFYFLEMNTRLQVEHPVTECITGLDLVAMQFDVAEGKALGLVQEELKLTGWAMEARLYAEDASQGFMPQTGKIGLLEFPAGEGVRVDSGVETGDDISAFYDPMIAKVIAYGATRDEAREKLANALRQTVLLGPRTNADFLVRLLEGSAFANGAADIGYIERNIEEICGKPASPAATDIAIAAAVSSTAPRGGLLTGWNSRGSRYFPMKLRYGDEILNASAKIDGRMITGRLGEEEATLELTGAKGAALQFVMDDIKTSAHALREGDEIFVQAHGAVSFQFEDITYAPAAGEAGGADAVLAPMAGMITSINARAGDKVSKGDTLAGIEAMKMEHQLKAPRDGVVAEVLTKAGDQVSIRAKLIVLETES